MNRRDFIDSIPLIHLEQVLLFQFLSLSFLIFFMRIFLRWLLATLLSALLLPWDDSVLNHSCPKDLYALETVRISYNAAGAAQFLRVSYYLLIDFHLFYSPLVYWWGSMAVTLTVPFFLHKKKKKKQFKSDFDYQINLPYHPNMNTSSRNSTINRYLQS